MIPMTVMVLDALKGAEARLKDIPDPRLDAEYLLAEILGVSRLELLLNKRRFMGWFPAGKRGSRCSIFWAARASWVSRSRPTPGP